METPSEKNLPLVSIDVPQKAVDELKGLQPGDPVRIVLTGTVAEVSTKEPDLSIPGFSGLLRVEVKTTKVVKQGNAFTEMAEDDN